MPVAKIHVHDGAFDERELSAIGLAVQAALEEVLSVPPEDYFRVTHVLPKGRFVHTPAFVGCTYSERLVFLELTFISGRPKEKRLALLAALNRLVVEKVGLRPDDLLVMIYEMPGNISFGQGLAQRARTSRRKQSLRPIRLYPDPARPSSYDSGSNFPEDPMHKAVIIGVGPDRGLGAQLYKRFAKEGLHVVAAGRTPASLDAVVADIDRDGGKASSFAADATTEADVAAVFEHAGPDVDLAVYNAGNNTPGRILEMETDYFEKSWRVVCYGGFLFGREALRRMVPRKRGTILFTGASASLRGRAGYGAFNSAKAGLRTLAQAMAKENGPEGIHVGHVVVDGAVYGEKIRKRFPDADAGQDRMIDIEGIVECYAFLYRQHHKAWSFEVDVRTSLESW